MKHVGLAALGVALAGCATAPSATKVEAFGVAVTAGSTALDAVAGADKQIAIAIGEEDQAMLYVRGGPATVVDKPASYTDAGQVAIRREAIAAIADYGKALKDLSADASLKKIEDAGARVGEAASKILEAFPGLAIAAPIAKMAGRGLGIVVADKYTRRAQEIIRERNADIKILVAFLKEDLGVIYGNAVTQLAAYQINVDLQLRTFRPRVNAMGRYERYKAARREFRALAAATAAASNYADVLDGIARAHDALAKGEEDPTVASARLLGLATGLTAVIAAAKVTPTPPATPPSVIGPIDPPPASANRGMH